MTTNAIIGTAKGTSGMRETRVPSKPGPATSAPSPAAANPIHEQIAALTMQQQPRVSNEWPQWSRLGLFAR